jgi:hypothetical protein
MIAGADNPGSLGTAASASAMGSSRIYSNAGEKNQFPTSAVAFPGPQSASPANNLKPSSEAEEPAFKPTNHHLFTPCISEEANHEKSKRGRPYLALAAGEAGMAVLGLTLTPVRAIPKGTTYADIADTVAA